MECKNCKTSLKETAYFCDNCGGKVIKHRLNFKTATAEFFATFISWDNKFFKTFAHLLTKPQIVANGYLNGIRKKYMQPFAYMIVALTFYSIYLFFAKDQMLEYMDQVLLELPQQQNKSEKFNSFMDEFMEKWISFITQYFNVFTFLMIPILSIINRIIFKKLNFIEHNVSLFYAYATYMLAYTVLGFIGLTTAIHFTYIYPITMAFMLIYHMYFYKDLFQLTIMETILKTLLFWIGLFLLYLLLGILIFIIAFILLKLKIISF